MNWVDDRVQDVLDLHRTADASGYCIECRRPAPCATERLLNGVTDPVVDQGDPFAPVSGSRLRGGQRVDIAAADDTMRFGAFSPLEHVR